MRFNKAQQLEAHEQLIALRAMLDRAPVGAQSTYLAAFTARDIDAPARHKPATREQTRPARDEIATQLRVVDALLARNVRRFGLPS